MKSYTLRVCGLACLSAAVLAMTPVARADQAPPVNQGDRTFTGIIKNIDSQDHTLTAKGTFFSKRFNVGDGCTYSLTDNSPGNFGSLRMGEKVKVSYQDSHGVLIADCVEQKPMTEEGMVKAIDPMSRTLTIHRSTRNKDLQIAGDCQVVLRDNKRGTLNDILPGERVTITYELPDGTPTVRQISQTSQTFTGSLVALDLSERTVKASNTFDTKRFNLADHCAIVVNGKLGGRLDELKPDDKLVFSYDQINGVNVVNRIGSAPEGPATSYTTTQPGISY